MTISIVWIVIIALEIPADKIINFTVGIIINTVYVTGIKNPSRAAPF